MYLQCCQFCKGLKDYNPLRQLLRLQGGQYCVFHFMGLETELKGIRTYSRWHDDSITEFRLKMYFPQLRPLPLFLLIYQLTNSCQGPTIYNRAWWGQGQCLFCYSELLVSGRRHKRTLLIVPKCGGCCGRGSTFIKHCTRYSARSWR